MPFDVIETETETNAPPTALLQYLRPKPRATKNKNTGRSEDYDRTKVRPALHITIPTTICGTSTSEKFALLVGSGSDAGKLRIKGSKVKTAVKPHQFKHAFRWRFGFVPRLGNEVFDERRPVRKISDDEFEVEVEASWFEVSNVRTEV